MQMQQVEMAYSDIIAGTKFGSRLALDNVPSCWNSLVGPVGKAVEILLRFRRRNEADGVAGLLDANGIPIALTLVGDSGGEWLTVKEEHVLVFIFGAFVGRNTSLRKMYEVPFAQALEGRPKVRLLDMIGFH